MTTKLTSGVERANWPIQSHWNRIITFASAWSGLNPDIPSNWTGSEELLAAAGKGLDWWFERDFTSDDCIGLGGATNATCPCGTPGLWNTNWFDQIILIPQLASTACLLLESTLTQSQEDGCFNIPYRAYERRDEFINGLGYLTGANTINVMQNSVSLALYTGNQTILEDALDRAMAVVTFSDKQAEDGIHRDGSFLQHNGILYNGNYGKDLINAFIQLEGEAIGTSYAANDTTREAFAAMIHGSEWMIYVDQETKQEHWDFNVIGRFVAFPTPDLQASADINFNVTKLAIATADFAGANSLNDTVSRFESNGTELLVGAKFFSASDYMVVRRDTEVGNTAPYILTNKMLSNRSHNTEFTNSANPYGYHLGQGTLFSYVTGYEYRDIQAAWDWNLIPGTTTLLNHPKLNSSYAGVTGKLKFVGGVSDEYVGTSVEDYVDPHDASLRYRKAWFFLDQSVVVTTSAIQVNNTVQGVSDTSVVTVLDQRMSDGGQVIFNNAKTNITGTIVAINASMIWYGGNGYMSYDRPFQLVVSDGDRTGNWSEISTSKEGNVTIPIFSAHTILDPTVQTHSYAMFPASDPQTIQDEMIKPTNIPYENNGVPGVAGDERLSLVFWPGTGTTAELTMSQIGWGEKGNFTVESDTPGVFLFALNRDDGTVVITFAEPTQTADRMTFSLTATEEYELSCLATDGPDSGCSEMEGGVKFDVELAMDGSSMFADVVFKVKG